MEKRKLDESKKQGLNREQVKDIKEYFYSVGMVTALFVALRILEVMSCSWLWVFSPVWLPPVLGAIVALLGGFK